MSTSKFFEMHALTNNITTIIDNALHYHTVLFDKCTFSEQITISDILQILDSIPNVEIHNVLVVTTDLRNPKIIFQLSKNHFMVTANEVTNIENIDDVITPQDNVYAYTYANFKIFGRRLIKSKL